MALLLDALRRQARYNRWMNRKLYACASTLSDAQRRADRGAFFGSVHGTLNHLMLGDRLWLTHWQRQGFGPMLPAQLQLADDLPSLSLELYAHFDAMHHAREALDALLIDWLAAADEALLRRDSTDTGPDGRRRTTPVWQELQHLFNHQAHHRGQLTTLLTQAGLAFGSTDIIAMPPDA